jgi:hypothetical protein
MKASFLVDGSDPLFLDMHINIIKCYFYSILPTKHSSLPLVLKEFAFFVVKPVK